MTDADLCRAFKARHAHQGSPGDLWLDADRSKGRATIARVLGVEGLPASDYATAPFRYLWTQEDEPWIAGAIGCPPMIHGLEEWSPADIRHVVLWNPITNTGAVLGEARDQPLFIAPRGMRDELTVYADIGAFFHEWARRRHEALIALQTTEGLRECPDSAIPGALVLGDPSEVRIRLGAGAAFRAGPGLDDITLRRAIRRSANLPSVLEARGARG